MTGMSLLQLYNSLPKPLVPGSATGIDLLKILGGQTKILEGQKVVKGDKCKGISQLLGGTCLGGPPKSMPMGSAIHLTSLRTKDLGLHLTSFR